MAVGVGVGVKMALGELTLRFTSDGGYVVVYEQNGNFVEASADTIEESLHRLSMKLGETLTGGQG